MRGCRWVSAVVEDVPYTTQIEIIDKYNIGEQLNSLLSKHHSYLASDFVVHGDDPVLVSKRFESRDLMTEESLRMLMGTTAMVQSRQLVDTRNANERESRKALLIRLNQHRDRGGISTTSLIARILRPEVVKEVNVTAPTLRTLLDEFAASCLPSIPIIELGTTGRLPSGGWSYIGGSWDCFSAGHLRLLEDAQTISQKKGGRLLVGVWDDEV